MTVSTLAAASSDIAECPPPAYVEQGWLTQAAGRTFGCLLFKSIVEKRCFATPPGWPSLFFALMCNSSTNNAAALATPPSAGDGIEMVDMTTGITWDEGGGTSVAAMPLMELLNEIGDAAFPQGVDGDEVDRGHRRATVTSLTEDPSARSRSDEDVHGLGIPVARAALDAHARRILAQAILDSQYHVGSGEAIASSSQKVSLRHALWHAASILDSEFVRNLRKALQRDPDDLHQLKEGSDESSYGVGGGDNKPPHIAHSNEVDSSPSLDDILWEFVIGRRLLWLLSARVAFQHSIRIVPRHLQRALTGANVAALLGNHSSDNHKDDDDDRLFPVNTSRGEKGNGGGSAGGADADGDDSVNGQPPSFSQLLAKDVVGQLEFCGWPNDNETPFYMCSWLHHGTAVERMWFLEFATCLTSMPLGGLPRRITILPAGAFAAGDSAARQQRRQSEPNSVETIETPAAAAAHHPSSRPRSARTREGAITPRLSRRPAPPPRRLPSSLPPAAPVGVDFIKAVTCFYQVMLPSSCRSYADFRGMMELVMAVPLVDHRTGESILEDVDHE